MECSVGGLIYTFAGLINVELAFTRFVTADYILDTSAPPYQRDYFIGPYCTRDTSPPDWNPPSPPNYFVTTDPPGEPTDIVDGKTICLRVGSSGPWSCLPYGKYYNSYAAPYVLGFCTHNP